MKRSRPIPAPAARAAASAQMRRGNVSVLGRMDPLLCYSIRHLDSLLLAGADPNSKNQYGKTPLQWAVLWQSPDVNVWRQFPSKCY